MSISRVRRRLILTTALALAFGGSLSIPSVAAFTDPLVTTPPTGDAVVHDVAAGEYSMGALSDNGRYVILSRNFFEHLHFDLATDTLTAVPGWVNLRPLDDGRTVVARRDYESEEYRNIDIFTGDTSPFDGPTLPAELADLLRGWRGGDSDFISVRETSADGRYQIVVGSDGPVEGAGKSRTWVYDTRDERLVTPFRAGLADSNGGGDAVIASQARFVDGGTVVRYGTVFEAQAMGFFDFEIATGERELFLEIPAGTQSTDLSTNNEWLLFTQEDPEFRYVRMEVSTGRTETVGRGLYGLLEFFDDGHVFYRGVVDGVDGLYGWNGGDEVTLLTPPPPGEDVAEEVIQVGWTADGSIIVYRSTKVGADSEDARLLSRGVIAGQVPSSGSACADVVGADPGDFVGVNVTPVRAGAVGFGTLHSSGVAAGSTSNVNFRPGSADPNVAFVEVGADGQVCFTNSEAGSVDVTLDQLVVADPSALSQPQASGAARLLDTRSSGSVAAAGSVCTDVIGAEPGDFVGVNVTPVRAGAVGFGTLHSSDAAAGSTSNVNFRLGSVDPNLAFVEVGSDGQICFTNSDAGPVDVVLDELVVADASVFSLPRASGAARLLDTREAGPVAASATVCAAVVGAVAGDFVGVNVTPVRASAVGFGTLHPSGVGAGSTSSVNFRPGSVDPNLAFTEVGADGRVCFTNSDAGPVDVILDQLVVADPSVFALPTSAGAVRILDTR